MITVNERSSLKIDISLTDENGVVVPFQQVVSCRFQLSDNEGNIINDRSFDNGLITASPVILKDDDLATPGSDCARIFAVKMVYNSVNGVNMTATNEIMFRITDLKNIV